VHTAQGRHWDAAVFEKVGGTGIPHVRGAGLRALEAIDVGSVAVAALLVAALALLRGHVRRAGVAVALVVLSVGSAELLKLGLPTPAGRAGAFPSGHVTIAASLGLALVLVAPPVLRPLAALGGAAYAAGIALAVVVLGWHQPSDAVGAFFVSGFWAVALGGARRPQVSARGLALAVGAVAAALVVAGALATRHPGAVESVGDSRTLVALGAVFGAVSLATFAVVTPLAQEGTR
jgi:membrane-associated phospholipid phosphatase